MNIFGMGSQELLIILVGALLIFGPKRLPEVAGQAGKFLRDMRKMTTDLTGEFEKTAGVGDIKRAVQNELAGVQSTVNSATKSVQSTAAGAASSVNKSVASAASAAKGTSTTAAKSTSTATTAAKSTTASTSAKAKTTSPAKPVANKKDPLADVSFFADVEAAKSDVATAAPATNNGVAKDATVTTTEPVDALGRARQRRMSAGYNRRAS